MSTTAHKLKTWSFGFALGLWSGVAMLLLAWFGWWCNWGSAFINLLSSVYVGYAASFWGGVIGFVWAFVVYFIFGVLFAWVYNCCGCCGSSSCD